MNASARDDLSRLRAIAEEGRRAPLLGGWHLILWGSAIALALLINWAVAERLLPLPGWSLAISWFGITLAAWAGSALIGRHHAATAEACAVGNRVERTAWMTAGAFLTILALAILARGLASGDPAEFMLFAVMPPVTFGAYAVALQVSAVAAGSRSAMPYMLVALAFAALTTFLIGERAQYLAAAAGILLVSIPAGLGHLAAERRAA